MATDASATDIVQGDLIPDRVVHGRAMSCMIIPHQNPEEWYLKQFFTVAAMEEYAKAHMLVIKEKEL